MTILSLKWVKFIKSLQVKKYRKLEQCFVVEGSKSTLELLHANYTIRMIVGTQAFLQQHAALFTNKNFAIVAVSAEELQKLGSFQTNTTVLAVVEMKPNLPVFPAPHGLTLALDGIQDPGNLGTIIRIADWYGISRIICSEDTVDVYNPKTISATMGSFTRVQVYYTDLAAYLQTYQSELTIYGAFMDGENIHQATVAKNGILVMGNEANGIRDIIQPLVQRQISIPRFGEAESLNVAIATAVLCDNWQRMVS